MVHCTNRKKHSKPLVYQSSQLYQDCTNSVPTVYQSSKKSKTKTVKRQSKQQNDHWCTNRSRSTKTVPTVYKQCTNRQKQSKYSQNGTKMTIGVSIVTCLPRLYQPCTNSVPKQSKDSQNSKNDHWCTNRHRSTKTVPTV